MASSFYARLRHLSVCIDLGLQCPESWPQWPARAASLHRVQVSFTSCTGYPLISQFGRLSVACTGSKTTNWQNCSSEQGLIWTDWTSTATLHYGTSISCHDLLAGLLFSRQIRCCFFAVLILFDISFMMCLFYVSVGWQQRDKGRCLSPSCWLQDRESAPPQRTNTLGANVRCI